MAEWRNEGVKQFWADVGERLKLTRHLLNIAEQEAADAMLVTLRTYCRWERGDLHQDNLVGVLNFCETYGLAPASRNERPPTPHRGSRRCRGARALISVLKGGA
jgi:transcriptional regulator with XRE-family HTH domain